VFYNDIAVLAKTKRETIDGKKHPPGALLFAVMAKLAYLFCLLALPMLITPYGPLQVLLGFAAMHGILSLLLALVLMPAHLFEATHYPVRNGQGRMAGNWAVHQMLTTIDYSRSSRLCNFLLGGFNINVAHHLFPKICHVHLVQVSEIIKQTAAEYGIPYNETSLWGAIKSHFKTLRQLGRQENFTPASPFIQS
jgi:linoleoyl-CoA desaturase